MKKEMKETIEEPISWRMIYIMFGLLFIGAGFYLIGLDCELYNKGSWWCFN